MVQTVRKELLAQLQHLRTETKEISRLYVANLQRDIVQLIDFLNEGQSPTGNNKNSRADNVLFSRLKETLDEISVKPEKGRRKDLRRIEQAVRLMKKIAFSDKKDA
jgi:hypothetical protein